MSAVSTMVSKTTRQGSNPCTGAERMYIAKPQTDSKPVDLNLVAGQSVGFDSYALCQKFKCFSTELGTGARLHRDDAEFNPLEKHQAGK